jgi:hypothetical protein
MDSNGRLTLVGEAPDPGMAPAYFSLKSAEMVPPSMVVIVTV